jgi:hypothetical protein
MNIFCHYWQSMRHGKIEWENISNDTQHETATINTIEYKKLEKQ